MKLKKFSLSFFVLFLLVPFIAPEYLLRIHLLSSAFKFWKIFVGFFSFILLFKRKQISLVLVLLTFFYCVIIISAVFHGYSVIDYFNGIALLWLIDYLTINKEMREKFYFSYKCLFTIFVAINVLTMVLYPNGLYYTSVYGFNWFLGYKNVLIRRILPYILVLFISSKNRKMYNYEKFGLFCSILSIVLSKSFNGYVGLTIFFISYFVFSKNDGLFKKISLSKMFIWYCVLDFIMIKYNLILRFSKFITATLEKNGSMLGRINIWAISMNLIKASPVIGYGAIDSSMFSMSFHISHPHNLLLYYLMLGGLLCIFFFVISLMLIDKKSVKMNIVTKKVLYASYISYFSMSFLESLVGALFFIPFLLLIYNVSKDDENDWDMYTF